MSKKSKAPPAPEPAVTKPELPPTSETEIQGGAPGGETIPSTPALDDESLDSDSPPPPPADDEGEPPLDETGEHPALEDELPPTEPEEPEYGEDAPNRHEPIVPTLGEYLAAGYSEASYGRRFGRNPTPNTPAAKEAATPAPEAIPSRSSRRGAPSPKKAYAVWAHGSLQRDGITYLPGAEVMLTEAEAEAIGPCVAPPKEPEPAPEPEGDGADDEDDDA